MPKLRSFELQTLLIAIRCIPDGVALPAIRDTRIKGLLSTRKGLARTRPEAAECAG